MSKMKSIIIGVSITLILIAVIGWENSSAKSLDPAQEIMQMMEDLCNISGYGIYSGIHPGPKADQAAHYILQKLQSAGLNATLQPVKINNGFPTAFGITVNVAGEGSRSISGFPYLWTVGTPVGGITGQLAYVGAGAKSNFELVNVNGKIALIDHVFYRHYDTAGDSSGSGAVVGAVTTAQKKGAIAVICAEEEVDGPRIKWLPGTPTNLFPIPCFSVGKSEGDYLRNLAVSGKSHTVNYQLSVPKNDVVDSFNVVAELPGNGSMDEVILVATHYDTVFTGAIDNLSSDALMINLAKYFASKPQEQRNRDMIFALCIGHDAFDGNSGHYQFGEKYRDRLGNAIVWDVDHAVGGTKYVNIGGKLYPTTETSEMYTMANNYAFARLTSFYYDKYEFVSTVDAFRSPGSGPNGGVAPTNSPWVNIASITMFYHSMLDTPEKITLDQVKRAYAAHIEILEAVDAHQRDSFGTITSTRLVEIHLQR